MRSTKCIGDEGENIALNHLLKNGYTLLERNWRCRKAEIDLIFKDEDVLVFVEVKTRKNNIYGEPEYFVGERQKSLYRDAASQYMEDISHLWEIRFDIVSVIKNDEEVGITHFKDAFY